MDLLHDKIRKTKCPIVVDFALEESLLPEGQTVKSFCLALLQGLEGLVPGVRFSFDQFALMGESGLQILGELLDISREKGYFVIVDGPAILSPWAADRAAKAFFGEDSLYACDCLVLSPYIGSDAMKPFLPYCKDQGKSVFFAVRTANKSSAELQDLMTGSRLSHIAMADVVNRCGESILAKCGYSRIGALTAATSANAVMGLRSKYNRMFLLVDGLDYPGGNGKNCSYGFDRFGHGCAMSVGPAITGSWKEADAPSADFVECAKQAVVRIRNNMTRYVTIL